MSASSFDHYERENPDGWLERSCTIPLACLNHLLVSQICPPSRSDRTLLLKKNKIKYSLLRQELIDSLPVGVVLALVSQGPLLLFPLWLKATGCCPELPPCQSKTNKGEKVLGCRHSGINTETYTDMHTPADTAVNKEEFDIVCTHLLAKTVKFCTCICAVLLLPLTRAHNGLF